MDITEADKTECEKDDVTVCSPKHVVEKIKEELQVDGKTPEQVIEKSKKATNCDSESCVINKVFDNSKEILDEHFKPAGPRDSTNLLSNFNIDESLELYAKKYEGFYHVYFQMIDFAKVGTELATIDLVDLIKKGYKSMGVVLNTDVSTGRGIHWFCLFCDLTGITLEYFNSSGNRPRREVQVWLNMTKKNLEEAGYKAEIINASKIEHQIDSETECGPYSLYYIHSRLSGVPYTVFNKKRIPDDKMIEFRQTLFRKH